MQLNADQPIQSNENDVLGHGRFAKRLAESFDALNANNGFVAALNGRWGSGKTGIINLLKNHFKNNENIIIVEFNPWMFPSEQTLYHSFFETLAAKLKAKITGLDTLLSDIYAASEGIGIIKSIISVGSTAAQHRWLHEHILSPKWSEKFKKYSRKEPQGLEDIKDKISNAIIDSQKKIIVIIDDIDRLERNEIRGVFRLIKSVANFSNVIYLVSFDRRIANEALKTFENIDGEEYLEKIIQASFDVPPADEYQLRKLLFSKLDLITGDYKINDEVRWWNVYIEGIRCFLETPRDVIKLSNAFALSWPPVAKELDFIDFLFIETIRVFKRSLYEIIVSNKDKLTEYTTNEAEKRDKTFYDKLRAECSINNNTYILDNALMRIFPNLESIWGNMSHSSESYGKWKRQRRICSEDDFMSYFRLGIDDQSISQEDIRRFMSSSADQAKLEETLLSHANSLGENGLTKVAEFLERLVLVVDEIPTQNIQYVLNAILNTGDYLIKIEDKSGGLFTETNEVRLARLVYWLLAGYTEEIRADFLINAFKQSRSTTILAHSLSMLENERKKSIDKDKIPNEAKNQLRKIVLQKIDRDVKSGVFIDLPNLAYLFYRWRDLAGIDKVRSWTQGNRTDDELLKVMKAFTKENQRHVISDQVSQTVLYVNKKDISEFFDPDKLIKLANAISKNPKSGKEDKAVADRFLKGSYNYENND